MKVLITLTDVEPAVRLNARARGGRHRDGARLAARRHARRRSGARSRTSIVLTGALLDPHNVALVRELLWDGVAVVGLADVRDPRASTSGCARIGYVELFTKPDRARRSRRRRAPAARAPRASRQITGLIGETEAIREVLVQGRADGAGVEHGAHRRRERHRQGARRARASIASARGATSRSSPSTSARCPRRCSRASCSATRRARSPAPPSGGSGASSWRTAGRCSSTRSARSRRPRRSSSCACSRSASSRASAARSRSRWTCASSRRPTGRCASTWRRGRFRADLYYRLNVLQHLPAAAARAARATSRSSSAGSSASFSAQHDRPFHGHLGRGDAAARRVSVAGERARAAQPGREHGGARRTGARSGPADIPRQIREGGSARFLPVHIGPVVRGTQRRGRAGARVHRAQPGRAQAAGGGAAPADRRRTADRGDAAAGRVHRGGARAGPVRRCGAPGVAGIEPRDETPPPNVVTITPGTKMTEVERAVDRGGVEGDARQPSDVRPTCWGSGSGRCTGRSRSTGCRSWSISLD